jgi:hypothetical protein
MIFLFQSCSKEGIGRYVMRKQKPNLDFSLGSVPKKPNYSDVKSWIVKDNINETIDIFYVYPTSYYSPCNWNAEITDTSVIKRINKFVLKKQLDIFKGIGNIYAPFYRQANLYSFIDKDDNGKKAIDLAYSDVKRAFYYYIEHFNNTKPFMLVGHSQGSKHLLELLIEISKDSKIKNRIIATYAIGWPITKKYLEENPQIKICESYCQTGCVISWNTEGKHKLVSLVKEPSASVNPLTWKINDSIATKDLHKGAVFVSSDSIDTVCNTVSAQNKNGHLIISKPDNIKQIWMPFRYGNYHVHDFSMFYFNIQENAIDRKKCYWKH